MSNQPRFMGFAIAAGFLFLVPASLPGEEPPAKLPAARLDAAGDPLPAQALARLGTTPGERHGGGTPGL